jgi:nitrite reductase/ring-hydroxylating ferredoxin subunit
MPLLLGDADEGAIEVQEDRLVVVCPWHGWEFDARTGRMAWGESSKYSLRTYSATVRDGRVLVDPGTLRAA